MLKIPPPFKSMCSQTSPQDLKAFASAFGPLATHPLATRRTVQGHPEVVAYPPYGALLPLALPTILLVLVLILENNPEKRGLRNNFWH
eukprot:gene5577-5550_t